MKKLNNDLLVRGVKALSLVLMIAAFAASWYGYYADNLLHPYYRRGNWVIIALFAVFYIFLARIYDAYLISVKRVSEIIYSQVLSFLLADGAMFIVTWLINKVFPNVLPMLMTVVLQTAVSVIWSVLASAWFFKTHKPKSCFVIYDEKKELEQLIYDYGYEKVFDLKRMLSIEECIENIEVLSQVDTVFLSDIHSSERNKILKYCVTNNIVVYVIPRIGDVLLSGARRMHLFHMPVFRVNRYHPSPEYSFLKRTGDIILSLLGLIIASPIMLIISLAIKLSDGGPVFYKQDRLTKGGKVFKLIKFRSMRVDAEDDGIARLSSGDSDDRVTRVGKIIRKLRLDELPQLINILKGEMSVIGPRPERPEIAALYEQYIPEFSLRLQMNAGLTGYAQVYGKYNTTPYNKLEMDLLYISNPSILEDLRILFATIKIVFMPESTQGIDENELTALGSNEEINELTEISGR